VLIVSLCCAMPTATAIARRGAHGSLAMDTELIRFAQAYAEDQYSWSFTGAADRGGGRYLVGFTALDCSTLTGACSGSRQAWSMVVTAVLCPGDYWIFRVPGGRVKCLRLRFVG
jgi:hypothetical protein